MFAVWVIVCIPPSRSGVRGKFPYVKDTRVNKNYVVFIRTVFYYLYWGIFFLNKGLMPSVISQEYSICLLFIKIWCSTPSEIMNISKSVELSSCKSTMKTRWNGIQGDLISLPGAAWYKVSEIRTCDDGNGNAEGSGAVLRLNRHPKVTLTDSQSHNGASSFIQPWEIEGKDESSPMSSSIYQQW